MGRPTRFGNPFVIGALHPRDGHPMTRAETVTEFRRWLRGQPALVDDARRELRGRDLLCWCPPGEACHADVWLEVANA